MIPNKDNSRRNFCAVFNAFSLWDIELQLPSLRFKNTSIANTTGIL